MAEAAAAGDMMRRAGVWRVRHRAAARCAPRRQAIDGAALTLSTMASSNDPVAELGRLVEQFRHARAELARANEDTRLRRRRLQQLRELEQRFERLLLFLFPDEGERRAWRAHLHANADSPPVAELRRPPLFKGIAASGSRAEVGRGPDGALELLIDGSLVRREPADWQTGGLLVLGDLEYREIVDVPGEALTALRDFVQRGSGEPPWQWGRALYEDGLIDEHFGLTGRGRRLAA